MRKPKSDNISDPSLVGEDRTSSSDTEIRVLGVKVNRLKSLVKWIADFYVVHPIIATVMLATGLAIFGFRSVGLTPVKFLGKFVTNVNSGRRWTKICTYGIYPGQMVSTSYKKSDIEDILVDVATSDCDFYALDGVIEDELRSLIKHSKLDLNMK